MTLLVAHHGHCFDGMASAAFLTRFLCERSGRPLEVVYRGLQHQSGGSHVPDEALTGTENAVVDFRYTTSDRLHWYFDHHQSGVHDDERAHLAADTTGQKHWDPTYASCCSLLRDVLARRFGFDAADLAELVRWADMIDTAGFPSADAAVRLDAPALRLMVVIDVFGDDAFLTPRIQLLSRGVPLEDLASDHLVRKRFRGIEAEYQRTLRRIERGADFEAGVVSFDLAGVGGRYNRFAPYYLFPTSSYAVAVTTSPARVKVSVGSNPWAEVPRVHDIAALCASYGGGGHPAVGAVSFPADALDRARAAAAQIAATLRQGESQTASHAARDTTRERFTS